MTFSRWMKRLPDLSLSAPHLKEFLHFSELAAYSSGETLSSVPPEQISLCCAAILREISLAECQKTAAILRAKERSTLLEADRSMNFSLSPTNSLAAEAGSTLVSAS
jgi:hypothetical protein